MTCPTRDLHDHELEATIDAQLSPARRAPRVRAADPATLFRGGGKIIADHMVRMPVPDWVPARMVAEYQLDALFYSEHIAAKRARGALGLLRSERQCA